MQHLLHELFLIFEEGKGMGFIQISGRTILSIVFGAFVQCINKFLQTE
ncbi:hypothetical protein ACEQPO_14765 [Bacillus sp. SL00103]